MSDNQTNLGTLTKLLDLLCQDCDNHNSGQCKEVNCLAGFAKKTIRFAEQEGVKGIPGASKLIPNKDFKPYYQESVSKIIAESCRQCKECRENHSPDCVISLVRTAMEHTVLQEQVDYPGSVFMYLVEVKQQNNELSAQIAANMRK